MDTFANTMGQLAWGELSWLPGVVLVALGALLFAAALAWPAASPSASIRLVLRIRRLIWALVLALLGAGLVLQQPVLVVAALVFGFEETLETGIVLYALRRDPAA